MAAFVVAHGAWSAGFVWKKMHPLLHGLGHTLITPTQTGLGERVHLAAPDARTRFERFRLLCSKIGDLARTPSRVAEEGGVEGEGRAVGDRGGRRGSGHGVVRQHLWTADSGNRRDAARAPR